MRNSFINSALSSYPTVKVNCWHRLYFDSRCWAQRKLAIQTWTMYVILLSPMPALRVASDYSQGRSVSSFHVCHRIKINTGILIFTSLRYYSHFERISHNLLTLTIRFDGSINILILNLIFQCMARRSSPVFHQHNLDSWISSLHLYHQKMSWNHP